MITNVANINYDRKNIKNISKDSNEVIVYIYKALLNVCVSNTNNYISVNIFNNTGSEIKTLKIKDKNNNFAHVEKNIKINKIRKIKYKKIKKPLILICYIEENGDVVYISK